MRGDSRIGSVNQPSPGREGGSGVRLPDGHPRFAPYQQIEDIAYVEVAEIGTISAATPSQNSVSADRSTNPPSHVLT